MAEPFFRWAPRLTLPATPAECPVKVNVSGGRTSAMMLACLLENGQLSRERGDIAVFNNTSAEHPATYDFIETLAHICKTEFGIPFFVSRYCTYEDPLTGKRRVSYTLEHPEMCLKDGSTFEEMICKQRYLPSVFKRICTANLKIRNWELFAEDLMAGKRTSGFLGHRLPSKMAPVEEAYKEHLARRGGETLERFRICYEKLREYPTFRDNLDFHAYSDGRYIPEERDGYVSLVGFRRDEQRRVSRLRGMAVGGENLAMAPLYDHGITKAEVDRFWEVQPEAIRPLFPTSLNVSNCVYCFLKGGSMVQLHRGIREWEKTLPDHLRAECQKHGPHKIQWWIDLEKKYGRLSDGVPLGMTRNISYKRVIKLAKDPELPIFDGGIECLACTD